MATDLIQSLWIGPRLESMERMCLSSFVRHGHAVRLFSYAPIANVPEGVELANATEILPWRAVFRSTDGSYANFADVFRYKLLLERGGWWVDCDVMCLQRWRGTDDTVVPSTDEEHHRRIANVFVLRAPAGSPLMQACLQGCEQLGETRFTFAQTGPFLMNRIVREQGLESALVPAEVFSPVPWNSPRYFVVSRPFFRHLFHLKNRLRRPHLAPRFTARTIGMHLWSGMWRIAGLDRDGAWPRTSLYASLRRRYSTLATLAVRPGFPHASP